MGDLAAIVGAVDRQEGRGLVGGRRARVGRGVGGHGGAVAVGAVGVRVSQKCHVSPPRTSPVLPNVTTKNKFFF